MDNKITIIQKVFNDVSGQLVVTIEPAASAISMVITPLFGAALGLYIVYYGYKYLYDPPDIPVMDVVQKIAALAVVTLFAFNINFYMNTVVPFVMGAGDDIARAISGQSTVASQLDNLINQINTVVLNLWNNPALKLSITGDNKGFFMAMAEILIIVIGAAPFIIISLAYLLIAKVMVCLLLAVGSIFICMAFFPATRDNFKSWSAQCLNYIFLTILYSVAFSIEIALIQRYAGILTTPTPEIPSWNNALELCIIMLGFAAVTLEIPSLASHLAGGVGISGLVGNSASKMMMGGAGFAAGKLMGAGKMGGKMAGPAAAAGIQAGKQAGKFAGKVANAVVSKIREMGTKA